MEKFSYKTRGTCSRQIDFEVEGTKVYNVKFMGGCSGNTQGIQKLADGMEIDTLISQLSGIDCNGRGTSCPDQLAKALIQYKESVR